ncbi:hypothetical protein FA95DRAFT_1567442 [Auriscalpium vulgare]|uniref:Uncharacterized protein n=1 Tax=Auriscalpium vulgare TaxID=40419 RepID=A0ACB8R561_9AGAM|nr:hypothetical protein FA95DRAFT_1567442 [Auriscalpium vulgare]
MTSTSEDPAVDPMDTSEDPAVDPMDKYIPAANKNWFIIPTYPFVPPPPIPTVLANRICAFGFVIDDEFFAKYDAAHPIDLPVLKRRAKRHALVYSVAKKLAFRLRADIMDTTIPTEVPYYPKSILSFVLSTWEGTPMWSCPPPDKLKEFLDELLVDDIKPQWVEVDPKMLPF